MSLSGAAAGLPAGAREEREIWLSLVGLWLILIAALVVGYRGAIRSVTAFQPVTVEIAGRQGVLPPVRLIALSPLQARPRYRLAAGRSWRISGRPVSALGLQLPADWRHWLGTVTIRVGPREARFDAAALAARWRRGAPAADGGETWWAPAGGLASAGVLGRGLPAINGPGNADLALRLFTFPVLLVAGLGLLMALAPGWWRPLAAGAPSLPAAADPDHRAQLIGRAWAAFGVGIVFAAMILLERIDPYYFAQDDNLVQFLPLALDGCARLNHDLWPDYNLYQLMGQPMATAGIYGLSYPLLWAACSAADGLLHRPTATFEAYAAIHLVIGFLACFRLGRVEGLSAPLATALGLSFALSGFFLIAGRSWIYMLPVAAWLPLLLLSARTLASTVHPFRWLLASGLAIGIFFHAGNAQTWTYGVLAWALLIALAWIGGALARRRLVWAVAALLLGLAVAMPLLLPQLRFVAGLERAAAEGNGIWNALAALVLPYPLVDAGHPNGWGAAGPGSMSPFYYSGSLLTLAGALACLAALATLLRFRLERGFWLAQRWPVLALLALLLALGPPALLWSLLGVMPVFEHFTHPFKLLPWLVLGLNLAGAGLLQRLLPARGPWHMAAALLVTLLVLFNLCLARTSFFTYADDPYPPLPAAIDAVLRPAGQETLQPRVLAAAPFHTADPGFTTSLMHNLPTYHRVMALDGYGSMLWFSAANRHALALMRREPEAARRAYGVRWLLRYRPPRPADRPLEPGDAYGSPFAQAYMPAFRGAPVAAKTDDLTLYDLGAADPLAFVAGRPEQALPARAVAGRLAVALPPDPAPRRVVLNFLKRPGSLLTADGVPLALEADAWGRIVAEVPAGARLLVLDHAGGWGRGLIYAIVLALVACAIQVVAVRLDPTWHGAHAGGTER